MTSDHSSYDNLARGRRGSPDYREGYAEAQRAFLIGQAIRERGLGRGPRLRARRPDRRPRWVSSRQRWPSTQPRWTG